MYLRRVGIDVSSYAAAPTQASTGATPPAPAAKSRREKRRGEGGGDAAAAGYKQLGSCAAGKMKIRLYVYRGKLILAAMYLRRVGIDGPIYAAACLTNGRWPRNKWKHNISEVVQQEK
jgi:hypothetical protein